MTLSLQKSYTIRCVTLNSFQGPPPVKAANKMILGIGIDAVAIQRFTHWHAYSKTRLSRLFSEQEIAYCLQEPAKSAERFAARFAAKEALYKALSQAGLVVPFLTLCKTYEVVNTPNGPRYSLSPHVHIKSHLSITHTKSDAYAFCILEKQ